MSVGLLLINMHMSRPLENLGSLNSKQAMNEDDNLKPDGIWAVLASPVLSTGQSRIAKINNRTRIFGYAHFNTTTLT